MNTYSAIHEVEERIDEIGWLLKRAKRAADKPKETLANIVLDINYQSREIEKLTHELWRGLR